MAAAELKLQVGLDLAFFRQQLAQLGTTATGYSLPINIDRLAIQKEITKLGRNISNRSYTLKVKTTAAIAEAEVDKLKTALDNLQGKEVGIKITGALGKIAPKDATKIRNDLAEAVAGGTGKKILVDVSVRENAIGEELRAVRKALNEKITPKNGKILVAASIRSGITNEEAKEFRESVKRKVGNIIVNVTGSADQLRAKEAKSIRTSLYQSIISNGGKIKIPATLTIADSEVAAFQKAVNSKFAGITVKVKAEIEEIQGGKTQAQIEKEAMAGWQRIQEVGAARMSGGSSDPARRESLRQSLSGRDIGELRSIGEQLGVKGARRYSNVQNLIEKIVADASIEMIKKYLDPQAVMRNPDRSGLGKVLDTFARGVFHMLGMDPAAMMAAQKQKLLPPSISWPASAATSPSYQGKPGTMLTGAPAPALINGAAGPVGLLPAAYRGIGQSAGPAGLLPAAYRGIAGAPVPRGLGGTAFGAQKYLPTALGNETKKVLRDAANAFLDTIRQGIREVKVQDLGRSVAGQKVLPGKGIAGLLPPSIGRTPSIYATSGETQAELFARREKEARIKSAFREMDAMGGGAGRTAASYSYAYRTARPTSAIVPYGPGGALVAGGGAPPAPPSPPSGGRGGFGSFGSFRGAMPNVSLPGAGLVKEVGDQFGYAAQQVLLFGTTYKALAFLTDFPSKVGEAVAQLQTFRNTLQAITPNADEFQKSNQFILDTVAKYNTPLQSARDGFTNLYASMAPAGFKGDEIRNIFSGISQGAATFGMSADKVDRVNYAFAQMASKGQVMSEELKGQLGDVLPGAVAIFAKAAGFEGSNAMVDFTKAMEEGRYKGEAMKQLLINVGIVMKDKFAKGAEGAAQNFQGQMNAMGNATKKLYEAFVPVANAFAGQVIKPFTEGLKIAADGFNAFFAGTAAKTAGGFALSQELEKLRPTFLGIKDNVRQLLPTLQAFATTALGLAKILLQIAGSPFIGYLARVYLPVVALTTAIQALNLQALIPMIANLLRAIPAFISYQAALLQGVSANKSLQSSMALTGQSAGITAGKIRLVSAALGSLAVGGIVLGIGVLIERFMSLGAAIDGVHQATKQTVQGISSLANTGDVGGLKNILADTKKQVETFKGLRQFVGGGSLGAPSKQLTQSAANQMKALGLERFVSNDVFGKPYVNDFINASKLIEEKLKGLEKAAGAVQEKLPLASKIAENIKQQAKKVNDTIAPIPEATDPKEIAKQVKAAAALYENRSRVADDLSKMQTAADIERETAVFNFRVDRMNAFYDMQEARANSFQKASIQFQREMFNIEVQRQKANLDAQNQIAKAQGSVAGGGNTAGAYLQGDIGPTSTGPHFDVKKVGGGYFDRKLLDKYVQVNGKPLSSGTTVGGGTFAAHQDRGSSGWDYAFGAGRQAATLMGGAQWLEGKPTAHGEQRRFQIPTGEQFQFLHGKSEGIGAMPPGKIAASQARTMKAELATNIAITKEHETATRADEKALLDQQVAMQKYVSSIMPIAEQELQIQLLQKRSELTKSGISQEQIDTEMQIFETRKKSGIALEDYTRLIKQYENAVTTGEVSQGFANKAIAGFRAEIDKINKGLPLTVAQIEELAVAQSALKFDQAMQGLRNQIDMARALTPEQEMRTQIKQEGYVGAEAESILQERKTLQSAEKLKADLQGIASTIGTSFGDAFKGIITGSMTAQEALASFFQNIGNYFVDMVAKMIAEWAKTQVIQGFQSLLGGLGGMFGGGGSPLSNLNAPGNINNPLGYANGGLVSGGFQAFASGGIVTGPTLGLIGEGRYNEAVIPLPDGKSVPVDLGGLSGGMSSGPITVNVSVDAKGTEVQGDNGQGAALGRAIAASVQAELIKQKRPGGLLAR
jgi:tape measure domain-containing protein